MLKDIKLPDTGFAEWSGVRVSDLPKEIAEAIYSEFKSSEADLGPVDKVILKALAQIVEN